MNQHDIHKVLESTPELTYTGFVHRRLNSTPEEIEKGREELRNTDLTKLNKLVVMKTLNETARGRGHSYGLKHLAEEVLGGYVSNGALILVGIHLGLEYEVDGPNAIFRYKAKNSV